MAEEKEIKYNYLMDIDSPADLKKIPQPELPQVCNELREYIIDIITQTGGHFGAGLGIVELTVALHYVFDTPVDKIIFDTGHQGYPHKVLTGRRDLLKTIRQKGGISGFLKRTESEYDVFGAGHASTSISSALGIAAARDFLGKDYKVISVIGDGAMTGGLAFEAMNNIGFSQRNILVILNDNNVSISPNVSAFSNYFNEIYSSGLVNKVRKNIWEMTGKMDELGDRLRKLISKVEDGVKAIITPGVLFEALGFNYFGPINGHNIQKLVKMLSSVKDLSGPVFLHVMTQKGKGFALAEQHETDYHAIGKIDKSTGKSLVTVLPTKKKEGDSYSDIFGSAMVELCKMNNKIVAVTAAMVEGTGLNILQKEYPERVIDVGIAEGHAVTFSSGMATQGMIPVVAIYSTFLQRAYDHIIHDCALQKLHVVFALDRAGLVGADGPTHHGVLDLSYLRSIQNMTLMAPKDEQELRDMLYSAVFSYTSGPVAIRFPRGKSLGIEMESMKTLPYGKGEVIKQGKGLAIIAIGNMVMHAYEAAVKLEEEGISITVVNARFVKPIDSALIEQVANEHDILLTVEDNQVQGGFGSAVLECLNLLENKKAKIILHGIPDKIIDHGTQEELYHDLMLDPEGIANKVKEILNKEGMEIKSTEHEKNRS